MPPAPGLIAWWLQVLLEKGFPDVLIGTRWTIALLCNSNCAFGALSRKQKRGQKCPSMYPFFWGREEVGRVEGLERWRGLSFTTTDCFASHVLVFCLVGVFLRVSFWFFFLQGYFNCIIDLIVSGKVRQERVGWKKVRGAIFAVRRKVCWNRVFIQFAALFPLAECWAKDLSQSGTY